MTVSTKLLQLEVRAINKAGGPLAAAGSALVGLMGAATGAGVALGIAGAALIAIGVGAVAAGAKVWGFVEDAVAAAAEFESQMAILDVAAKRLDLTLSDLGDETLDGLHDVMLRVGLDTQLYGVDALEATAATTEFVKAGLSEIEMFGDLQGYMAGTAELSGGLKAAIDMATASELSHVEAATFATITLATYGAELETATERALFMNEAVDYTVRAADASTASVLGLTQGLEHFGPVANMFGISVQDTNILLAILSDRGIEGAEAGTALRSMFRNLTRDTAAVNEMYEQYGITLYDTNGTMLSAQEIVGQFEAAIVGLTEEEKHLLIQTTAGAYGQKALNALLIEGTEGWGEMEMKIADASGVLEIAAARTDTLSGDQEILGGVIQTNTILLGEEFIPVWREMTQWFIQMSEENGPAVLSIFRSIAGAVETLADIITGPLGMALTNLFIAMGSTEASTDDAAGAVGTLIGKFLELTVGGLLATVTIGIQYLTWGINTAKGAVDWFRQAFDRLEGVLWKVQNALKWVRDWINAVKTAFAGLYIPDWLQPGSPAPLETALRGIGKAFAEIPQLTMKVGVPVGRENGSFFQITNHFGPGSVRSDRDILAIADAVQRSMELQGVRARIA